MLFYPIKTDRITDRLYAVRTLICNFYLYDTGQGLIAFDTGISPLLSAIGLRKLGLNPGLVTHVFLTHSDYDHAGGRRLFPNAVIHLSAREIPMVTGRKPRLLFIFNRRIKNVVPLSDRQTVQAGSASVQLLDTPGHTVGSACYLLDDRILVAGDTLRVKPDGRITPFLAFQNMNHRQNKASLDTLYQSGLLERVEWLLTGHTGVLSNQPAQPRD